ncbi:MAG: hypothetical protein ACK4N5_08080, partial [Myxococcales bacterium]
VIDTSHQAYIGGEVNKLYAVDLGRVRATIASALRVSVLLGLIEVALAAGVSALGLLRPLFDASSEIIERENLSLALVVLVALWALPGSVGGVLVKLYPPAGLFARSQWWGVSFRLAQAAAVGAVAASGGTVLAACLASGTVTLALALGLFVDLRTRFPALWPFWRGGDWRTGFGNFGRSIVLVATSLLLQLQGSWLMLLVSGTLGVGATAAFGTLRTLANTFLQGVQVINSPVVPEVVRYHSQRDARKVEAVFSASWWAIGTCVNLGMLIALPAVELLYRTWTRGRIAFDWVLFLFLAWSVCLKAVGAPLANYLAGINHLRAQGIIALSQGLVVFAVALGSLERFQLAGLGGALAVGELCGAVVLPAWFAAAELRGLGGRLPLRDFACSLAGCATVGATFLAFRSEAVRPAWAISAGVLVLLAIHALQWCALPGEVRERLLRLVRIRRRSLTTLGG